MSLDDQFRIDLELAHASIDWAETNLPLFKSRINEWLKCNLDVVYRDVDANTSEQLAVIVEKSPLPLLFSVEAGAYINSIRSSLDILATALANRYAIPRADKAYWPVAASAETFHSGRGFKGEEFVRGLPKFERSKIEAFEPYKGGNRLLVALHELDIKRKHKTLLTIESSPKTVGITLGIPGATFRPISAPTADGETILGFVNRIGRKPNIKFTGYVAINDAIVGKPRPVNDLISSFIFLARNIIWSFEQQ